MWRGDRMSCADGHTSASGAHHPNGSCRKRRPGYNSRVMRRISIVLAFAMSAVVAVLTQTSSAPAAFTIEQVLSLPTPDNLIASPTGSTIAWTFNERGVRNIYA